MRKSEATPFIVQERITARERSEKARALADREKCANDIIDGFYSGNSTDNTNNYDKKEINSYMSAG